jgi:hypothetical protein
MFLERLRYVLTWARIAIWLEALNILLLIRASAIYLHVGGLELISKYAFNHIILIAWFLAFKSSS